MIALILKNSRGEGKTGEGIRGKEREKREGSRGREERRRVDVVVVAFSKLQAWKVGSIERTATKLRRN